jgi:hypothetical protein
MATNITHHDTTRDNTIRDNTAHQNTARDSTPLPGPSTAPLTDPRPESRLFVGFIAALLVLIALPILLVVAMTALALMRDTAPTTLEQEAVPEQGSVEVDAPRAGDLVPSDE